MTTLTLQPDAAAGIDTYIVDDQPTFNNGVTTYIIVGERNDQASVRRGLIKFDLSSLPATAIISSATLSLYCTTDYSTNARTFRIYRMIQSWIEGTGNWSASGDGATWNTYDGSNTWTAAGGFNIADCEQTDIGYRDFTATEALNEFKDFSLTPTTKAGLDLGEGWMIKADTEVDDAYMFDTSDSVTPANRPKLVVVYTLPGGAGARLLNLTPFNHKRRVF